MKKYILALLVALAFLFTGCAGYMKKDADGNYILPNFQDGTWSSCSYTSKSGNVTVGPPVQLGGFPIERTDASGRSVKCVPIPMKEAPKEPAK